MEDKKKVDAVIARLRKETGHKWAPAEGLNTMLVVKPNASGGLDVDNNLGITVKVFVDSVTGEVRTFYYKRVI